MCSYLQHVHVCNCVRHDLIAHTSSILMLLPCMTTTEEKITITNDKGRLTEEQIEKMIREAEEFADEDKKVKERRGGLPWSKV